MTLIDLGDGLIFMSPRFSRMTEIAERLAKNWQGSGKTLESLSTTLREVLTEHEAK